MKKIIFPLILGVVLIAGYTALQFFDKPTPNKNTTENMVKNMIKMTTSMGEIDIELYPEEAPDTVQNFIDYVESGHYDGLIFHRVIPDFMVQGGGFSSGMNEKQTQAPIKNEADNGLKNTVGSLSMARTAIPDSATSQFFINLVDNEFLNFKSKTQAGWGYVVFAKVINGMGVVEKIGAVQTGQAKGHGDVPLEDVVIEKAEVITE